MRSALVDEVRRSGVVSRERALAVFAEHVVDDAVTDGVLVRAAPQVYALAPGRDRTVRRLAALTWRPDGALSHTDALDVWGLPTRLDGRIHLTVPATRAATSWPTIICHRRRGFGVAGPGVVRRGGLRVVALEQAVVESWPLLPAVDRRLPTIVAIRERRTTGERLASVLDAQPRTAGVAGMRAVFALAAAGCHSPLEMWGHEHVFSDPRLPPSRCQVPVDLPTGRVYLDRLYADEMVDVELDGAAYHGAAGQRERDLRRDAALAALGYLTLRFSHQRLHADPGSVVAEVLAVLTMRRRQLRPAG